MSYTRGNWYVWGDGHRTHIWARQPDDDVSVWVQSCEFVAGVAVPDALFDELAVMRVAELQREGSLEATQKRAVRKWAGNGGCTDLVMQVRRFTIEQYFAWSERRVARWFKKHPVSNAVDTS